jgi:hypothetical protein
VPAEVGAEERAPREADRVGIQRAPRIAEIDGLRDLALDVDGPGDALGAAIEDREVVG